MGASFDTGNLGFSALTESAIKCLLHRWPSASIILAGTDRLPGQHLLEIDGQQRVVQKVPIRFSKNIWMPYHFCTYVLLGILWKGLPIRHVRNWIKRRNPYFRCLIESDLVADLTGGDSFSDIYGLFRMTWSFLGKWLMLFYGKPFYLFPQTYGPYQHRISKWMARFILKRSKQILARDRVGVDFLSDFLRDGSSRQKIRFVPDVAFVLDPKQPAQLGFSLPDPSRALIGLNISGLLYHGGYTRKNMFGLSIDYPEMIQRLIRKILKQENYTVLLVPHVFPPPDLQVESDPVACQEIYEKLKSDYPDRLLVAGGKYNQNEIKYIIGRCGSMMGSRMHSCIASLSQEIPTLGLAYSKKFYGVFETVGMQDWVVDMRRTSLEDLFLTVDRFLENQQSLRKILQERLPAVREQVLRFCMDLPWETKESRT